MSKLWLINLPSTDDAFRPLHRVAEMDPEEFPALRDAHQQALHEAAWGASLATLAERAEELRLNAQHAGEPRDQAEAEVQRRDELEALGYALGVTAVKVALRDRQIADIGAVA